MRAGGWFRESYRHGLAARGIATAYFAKKKPVAKSPLAQQYVQFRNDLQALRDQQRNLRAAAKESSRAAFELQRKSQTASKREAKDLQQEAAEAKRATKAFRDEFQSLREVEASLVKDIRRFEEEAGLRGQGKGSVGITRRSKYGPDQALAYDPEVRKFMVEFDREERKRRMRRMKQASVVPEGQYETFSDPVLPKFRRQWSAQPGRKTLQVVTGQQGKRYGTRVRRSQALLPQEVARRDREDEKTSREKLVVRVNTPKTPKPEKPSVKRKERVVAKTKKLVPKVRLTAESRVTKKRTAPRERREEVIVPELVVSAGPTYTIEAEVAQAPRVRMKPERERTRPVRGGVSSDAFTKSADAQRRRREEIFKDFKPTTWEDDW